MTKEILNWYWKKPFHSLSVFFVKPVKTWPLQPTTEPHILLIRARLNLETPYYTILPCGVFWKIKTAVPGFPPLTGGL